MPIVEPLGGRVFVNEALDDRDPDGGYVIELDADHAQLWTLMLPSSAEKTGVVLTLLSGATLRVGLPWQPELRRLVRGQDTRLYLCDGTHGFIHRDGDRHTILIPAGYQEVRLVLMASPERACRVRLTAFAEWLGKPVQA